MTRAALIRALVEAAEALPELSSHAAIKAEMEVLAHAYALRRAKDAPRTPRAACPRCARVVSVRGKYMREHRDALGDGWCYRVEVGS